MKGKILVGAIAVLIVAVFAFGFLIPYGIEASAPRATVQIYVQDVEENGDIMSASVDIGQPSNTLALKRPDISFKPLMAFNQTVKVYPTHQYKIWVTVTFDYTGKDIKTYDRAEATILAKNGLMMLINTHILNTGGAPGGPTGATPARTVDSFKLVSTVSPVGTPPIALGMDPADPYFGANTIESTGVTMYKLIYGTPQAPQAPSDGSAGGIGIEGITIDCTVAVYGTANDGTAIVGTVTATLVLHADTSVGGTGGSISVSVTDMGAGISGT